MNRQNWPAWNGPSTPQYAVRHQDGSLVAQGCWGTNIQTSCPCFQPPSKTFDELLLGLEPMSKKACPFPIQQYLISHTYGTSQVYHTFQTCGEVWFIFYHSSHIKTYNIIIYIIGFVIGSTHTHIVHVNYFVPSPCPPKKDYYFFFNWLHCS